MILSDLSVACWHHCNPLKKIFAIPTRARATMASSDSTQVPSYYSDKQAVSSIDHGPEVVAKQQPYPDAYAYAHPNNANYDGSKAFAGAGDFEAATPYANKEATPAWSEQKPKRRICGLSRKNLIIVVAVVTALAVAAIIGGSVGGVLASKNSSGSAQADSTPVSWLPLAVIRVHVL